MVNGTMSTFKEMGDPVSDRRRIPPLRLLHILKEDSYVLLMCNLPATKVGSL